MAKKPSTRPRFAPLQEVTLVPVTDPAEQAELERRLRDAKEIVIRPKGGKGTRKPTVSKVEDLYQQLPAHVRLELLTRLAAELSPDEQRKLVAKLLAQLPSDALPLLEKQERRQSGDH